MIETFTLAAMRVCAARLDPNVTHEAFVEMLTELVRAAVAEQAEVQSPPRPAAFDANGSTASAVADHEPARDEQQADAAADEPAPRRMPPPPGRKLSYDDRTRIRSRYQAAQEDALKQGRSRLPNGFVRNLAAEFGVSDQTILNIGRNRDSF